MKIFIVILILIVSMPVFAVSATAEKFSVTNVVKAVSVSPDGNYVAFIKSQPRTGGAVLEVYETDALGNKPFRMSHEPMQMLDLAWVSDETLLLGLLTQDGEQREPLPSIAMSVVDVRRESVTLIPEANPMVAGYWPSSGYRIVLSVPRLPKGRGVADTSPMPARESIFSLGRNTHGTTSTSQTDAVAKLIYGDTYFPSESAEMDFAPREFFDLNLRTNKKRRLFKKDPGIAQIKVDGDGTPWLGRGVANAQSDYIWYVPAGEAGGWREIFRLDRDSSETFRVEGFDVDDPNILLVTASNGAKTVGLWEFLADRAQFGELIYRRPDTDVIGVRYHSNAWANPDVLAGVVYYTDKQHVEYFDAQEAALHKQLAGVIPAAFNLTISSRSRDGQTITIHNVGPEDPGSNYLLKDGKLQLIGSSNPLLSAADLAPMQYVDYDLGDGAAAHVQITAPRGAAKPFPTVVLLRDSTSGRQVVDYDALAQVLTSSGYLVVQPDARGPLSQAEAVALVESVINDGKADPGRVALLGWTADARQTLQAASILPQPYQCVIVALTADNSSDSRTGSPVSVDTRGEASVPVLLVHSGRGLKWAGGALNSDVQTVKVSTFGEPRLGYGEKLFEFRASLFTTIIEFLKNDCGSDGL